jgi:VWFA-related protein
MHPKRWLWVVLLCLSVLVIHAQDPVFRVRVDVPVVALEAVVKDSNDRPLTHLSQADFEIYEDGQKQEIRFFEAAESSRSMILAFDVTGVMENSETFMQRSMEALFANVREQDKVAVGAIGPEFEMLMSFRKIDKAKPPKVKLPPTRIGSNIYQSLDMAARRFGKEDTRRAIIALTDGRDTYTFNETKRRGTAFDIAVDDHFKNALADARKRGVPYYFVAIDTDPNYLDQYDYEYGFFKNPAGYMRTAEFAAGKRSPTIADDYLSGVKLRMERLAEATGGRVVYAKSLAQVVDFFDRVSRELGYSYSMGYTPKASLDDGKAHKIEIRTKAGYKIEQSRTSYGGLK